MVSINWKGTPENMETSFKMRASHSDYFLAEKGFSECSIACLPHRLRGIKIAVPGPFRGLKRYCDCGYSFSQQRNAHVELF